jgi:small subunit ribosomal protein S8
MDSISNALAIIKNALMVHKETCSFPASKILREMARILKEEGFIKDFEKRGKASKHEQLTLKLRYINNQPAITEIKRVSRLSRRVYVKYQDIKILKYGITILSTPRGILSARNAKKEKVGGEVICKIK